MNKVKLRLQPGIGNHFEVYIKAPSEELFYKAVNHIKLQPVSKYDPKKKCSVLSLYYYSRFIKSLKGRNYEVVVTDGLLSKADRLNKKLKIDKNNTKLKYPTLWNEEHTLFDYQKIAANVLIRRRKFINATEMGLGKSPEAIYVILTAFDWNYSKALIVVPASLKEQWRMEMMKFSTLKPEEIVVVGQKMGCPENRIKNFHTSRLICKNCERYSKCLSMKKKGVFGIATDHIKNKAHRVVIINYEAFKAHKKHIEQAKFDVYIFDESSKLKNYNSQVTRDVKSVMMKTKRDDIAIFMSGTVIENNIIEFFPVFEMIDSAIFGWYANFKSTYLICDFWGKAIGIRNEKLLKEMTSKFMIRHTVAEVWKDRPPLFEYTRLCTMKPIQRKIYDAAVEGILRTLQDKELEKRINNAEVVTQMIYLIMVAGSAESIEELGGRNPFDLSAKLEMLINMIQDEIGDHKVVIFCRYANKILRPVIAREFDKHKIKYGLVTGGTTNKQKVIDSFKNSSDVNVLLCSDTLTYGANLQAATYLINFDLPWNPAVLDQRIARVYRRGQEKPVTIITLLTEDSMESYVLSVNYVKRKMFDEYIGSGIAGTAKKQIDVKFLLGALS